MIRRAPIFLMLSVFLLAGIPLSAASYHYDSSRSAIALSADDGKTTPDCFGYDPYGRETWRQAGHDTPFRYHGSLGVQTDDNGLCHMRARYYHPQIRRFLNADPIGFEGGSNWYQFAGGNPIAFADPLGLDPIIVSNNGRDSISVNGSTPSNWRPNQPLTYDQASMGVHLMLDGIGLVPGFGEPADGLNGVIYLFEGNRVDAGLSFASMIPIAGWGATGAKALRYVDEVGDGGQILYRGVPNVPNQKGQLAQQGAAQPRGSALDEYSLRRHVLGEDVNAGVTSWTTDPNVARRFSGSDGIIIEVNMSSVADRVVPRPNVGRYADESEVLLQGFIQGRVSSP